MAAQLWAEIRKLNHKPVVILLHGPMGVGKSTLVRALLTVARARGDFKGSPTFSLAHEYESASGPLAHIDWYRIEHAEELESMGMRDYLGDGYAAVFIEWADKFPEWSSKIPHAIRVNLEIKKETTRSVSVSSAHH
ncbi:MAG: tRNA (adenosine(37)-N6)-threonylcarbamoyltransferase complex ATPase subunit type 1 TsaE [Xanthomonadaceae bacterium]|nr:tRNA (adenosine(37)-N6)-threonylcarbamoyltransferase complex ATPase subunit type 1 TsaE [Xanthomonadaceae bacterium]